MFVDGHQPSLIKRVWNKKCLWFIKCYFREVQKIFWNLLFPWRLPPSAFLLLRFMFSVDSIIVPPVCVILYVIRRSIMTVHIVASTRAKTSLLFVFLRWKLKSLESAWWRRAKSLEDLEDEGLRYQRIRTRVTLFIYLIDSFPQGAIKNITQRAQHATTTHRWSRSNTTCVCREILELVQHQRREVAPLFFSFCKTFLLLESRSCNFSVRAWDVLAIYDTWDMWSAL